MTIRVRHSQSQQWIKLYNIFPPTAHHNDDAIFSKHHWISNTSAAKIFNKSAVMTPVICNGLMTKRPSRSMAEQRVLCFPAFFFSHAVYFLTKTEYISNDFKNEVL